jgi:predicted amidohydrolase
MNRSYLINNKGIIVAKYNKIHMFDVNLSKNESYRESNLYQKGKKLVTVKIPWATIGLTICYDLRFPTMYRKLAQAGAKIIFIPSAFTRTTGRAHWLTLVKARAIENGCFIVAPAQFGKHYKGRETFGHSVIISPWGKIVKIKKSGIGIITAELSLKEVEISRKSIPSLKIN